MANELVGARTIVMRLLADGLRAELERLAATTG